MQREWQRYDRDAKRRLRNAIGPNPVLPRVSRAIEELALTFDVRELPPNGHTAAALLALAVSVSSSVSTPRELRRMFDKLLEAGE